MSQNKAKKAVEHEVQPELIFDAKRDINPFWRSSLFSDVYLKNDVPREYKHLWENDEIGGFYNFYQGFVDLCVDTEDECFEKWREADTVKNWIVPIMDLLGWENNSERRQNSYMDNESFTVFENNRKQTYRPDLLYFDKPKHKTYTQKEKDIDKKILEARGSKTGAKIVLEAKYWDRLSQLSNTTKKEPKDGDSASALGPELQTMKYMELFDHEFGILSDGKTWRLFHRDLSKGMDRRSFDFDLGNLRELALDLKSSQNEEKFSHFAKYFYYFFSKESLLGLDEVKTAPFVKEIFEYSKKYAHSIEEDLKKRFILTMGVTCNALRESCEEKNEALDLSVIRNVAESHLFNILFVKSCEVRRVLPISSTQYLRYSLHEVIESIDAMDFDPDKDWDDYLRDFKFIFGKKFDWDGCDIFSRFINLYEIIHDGTAKSKDFGFEVEGFKESIFSKDEWRFAKKHKIKNKDMVEILFNLNFIESDIKGRKFQQIPYSYFTPRQLGSIYESLLEFQLDIAETDMIFKNQQWKKANIRSKKVRSLKLVDEHIVEKGDLFFTPDNKERKMTGSYYTPDLIVKYIIESSLNNKLESISADEILDLKICDPAMGSGHFLAGVIDTLVEAYRKKWSDENNDDIDESLEETSRKILDACIFGVDINPRAVKLAKMSLWLMSAYPGKKLENLEDQVKCGNSLIEDKKIAANAFQWEKQFKNIFNNGGFDAVIGNPPYGSNIDEYVDYFKEVFGETVQNYVEAYKVFIAKSLELVKSDGNLCFITPNTFIAQPRYKDLRSFLLDKKIEKIVDLGDNVFDGVVVPTAVLLVSKGEAENFTYINAKRKNKFIGDFSKAISAEVNHDDVMESKDLSLRPPRKLGKDELYVETVMIIKDAGIQHHRSGIGLKNKGGNDLRERIYSKGEDRFKNSREVWYGKLVNEYSIDDRTDEKFNLDYKNILREKESVSFSKEAFAKKEKILWRQTAPHLIATLDTEGKWFRNTIQCGWVKDEFSKDFKMKYILALFNSELFKEMYEEIVSETAGKVFPQVKLTYIKKLPLKKTDLATQNKICKIVDRILNKNGVNCEKEKNEINSLVNSIYGKRISETKALDAA